MSNFIDGLQSILSIEGLLLILVGVFLGIIFGATPGISTSMGMALILPITYSMGMTSALCILLGLYIGGVSGGLITAVLLNIPGTPGSIATTFDGSPMARRGDAGKALGVGMLFSFCGGMLSLIILIVASPMLAKVALQFTNVDYAAVTLMSFSLIASLSGKSLTKGLIAAILGIMLTTIGISPLDGALRYTLNLSDLKGGLQLLPVMVAVYAITEVLSIAERNEGAGEFCDYKLKGFGISVPEFFGQFGNMIRSTLIGTGIGLLPGIGANISNILAYTAARNMSKTPEKFGTGCVEGIVAPETANNAVSGGAMIPLLTMGIPGDAGTAILLAALTIHGVQAGPLLFTKNASLIYSIFIILFFSNIIMLILEYFGMGLFLKVLKVPKHILMSIIIVICSIGAFSINKRVFDIWTILVIAIIAYGMQKAEIPLAPFILGFVLGGMFESNLRRGLMFTDGSFLGFFEYPIAAVCLAIFALVMIVTIGIRIKNGVLESRKRY